MKSALLPFLNVLACFAVCCCGVPAMAAGEKNAAVVASPADSLDVPGDIFGFTDATGISPPGSHGVSVTIDGAFGKRDRSYRALEKKTAYERVLAQDFKVEVAFFTIWHSVNYPAGAGVDRNAVQFNGASFELAYLLVARTASNPFAVKLAVEPRWGRVDDDGRRAQSRAVEFKAGIDAPIVPGRLFWAANAVLGINRAQMAGSSAWATGSSVKLSTAVAAALTQSVFLGLEASYVASFDKVLGKLQGQALFLGPGILVKVNEKVALSAVLAFQVAGRAKATPGRNLDLENASRIIGRLKLGIEF